MSYGVIDTERLHLRPLAADDLDAFAAMYADEETARFIGGIATRAEVADWLERRSADYARQGYGILTVVEQSTGEIVGRCGLAHWTIEGRDELEVGYTFRRSSWGAGYASEAATAVRDHAVHVLGRSRLIALVDPLNIRSARVAERLGMRVEREVEFHGKTVLLYALNV